jgi:hypothetical protein
MHAIAGTHYIEIGGQKRPMRFGTNQTAKFTEIKKITLSEYSELMQSGGLSDLGNIRDLLFSALWAGAKTEKLPTDFDEATVGDWMDEADQVALMEQLSAAITGTANPNAKAQGKKK